ncbi:MAG: hypothetical protein WD056_00510 [Gemmatimonadota bacterium]
MGNPKTKADGMRRTPWILLLPFALFACDSSSGGLDPNGGQPPVAPLAFDAFYYDRAVHLSWELAPGWSGEAFRVYGKRATDANYFLVAEVTNCAGGLCSYRDINIQANVTYQYYVAAVSSTGSETASAIALEIVVPTPDPPPSPGGVDAVALDGGVFLTWNSASRAADDFAFYRIYFLDGDTGVLIGESDSEGFLDLLVQNGSTYAYFVTAVDDRGHESAGSTAAAATPRPDYHGEILVAFEDLPEESGFRFQENPSEDPIVSGTDGSRHFRLEADLTGWWLVPGPGVSVHSQPQFTTALRCGVAADPECTDVRVAPAGGYTSDAIELVPEQAYVLRVPSSGGGQWQYGLIRVTHVGIVPAGAIALFDWAFQLQPDNVTLAPPAP